MPDLRKHLEDVALTIRGTTPPSMANYKPDFSQAESATGRSSIKNYELFRVVGRARSEEDLRRINLGAGQGC